MFFQRFIQTVKKTIWKIKKKKNDLVNAFIKQKCLLETIVEILLVDNLFTDKKRKINIYHSTSKSIYFSYSSKSKN